MAKLVAVSACYGSSLGSNPDISKQYKIGNISTGVADTHTPANKKYTKKIYLLVSLGHLKRKFHESSDFLGP
jgi:hypothetical protein